MPLRNPTESRDAYYAPDIRRQGRRSWASVRKSHIDDRAVSVPVVASMM